MKNDECLLCGLKDSKDNTEQFKSIVANLKSIFDIAAITMHNDILMADNEAEDILIAFTQNEWEEIKNLIGGSKRKTFKIEFSKIVSEKLQADGLNCWVKPLYNWFSTKCAGKYSNKPWWRGRYCCIHPSCNIKYEMFIMKENEENNLALKIMTVKRSGFPNHEIVKDCSVRICGKKRENLKLQVLAKGALNVASENVVKKYQERINLPIKKDYLNALKYEISHENLLSTDVIADSLSAKLMCDKFCVHFKESRNFIGFIQHISIFPFGIIFVSQIQISMWLKIQKLNPIWFIDATVNLSRNLRTINCTEKLQVLADGAQFMAYEFILLGIR